jgi:DNA polymerase-3 subunit delta'
MERRGGGGVVKDFHGNALAVDTLRRMVAESRIPQTLLLHGPEGVGKATLARRLAAALLGKPELIENDDLSLAANQAVIADREKWTAEKRNEDPLLFSSHPDFTTFAPDGPLRQISIPQMRLLKERAQFKPLHGRWRVFLVDQLERANDQAANSLLKVLEEPPAHMIFVLTAGNVYDLLPTIRSRSVTLALGPLSDEEMREFLAGREGVGSVERRLALAGGRPGVALALDLESFEKRRTAMLALLNAGAGVGNFGGWTRYADAVAGRSEKLDAYLDVLYGLLEDLLLLREKAEVPLRNADLRKSLEPLAAKVSFEWIERAVKETDFLREMMRRNAQKGIALDAFAVRLREALGTGRESGLLV